MFYNHKILLFGLQNKQAFCMISLCDLSSALCSLDRSILCTQRIMGLFILITHKSTRSGAHHPECPSPILSLRNNLCPD